MGTVASGRLATPLRKGVLRMGKERWKVILRFVVCFLIIFLMMIYISPKAC